MSSFPLDIFPKKIQTYFKECNETLDSNIDYMGCSFLWGISTLIGKSYALEVKTGWVEYCNLWIACVGTAGVGKTPSMTMATRPFKRVNSKMISNYTKELDNWKNSPDGTDKPGPKQMIVNDITIEALVSLHAKNKNAIGLYRDELDGWVKNMARYSNGSDLPFWLTTWSSDSVSMNRKSGDSFLSKPFIPILGGVQPAILDSFSTEENQTNGFLDRILLCCPDIKIELYNPNYMSYEALDWYDKFVSRFHSVMEMNLRIEDDEVNSNIIKLSVNAVYEWEKAYNEITLQQNSDDENEYMKSMLPKQKSYIPRFILILHLLENFDELEIPNEVSQVTVINAKKLSDYFILQAKKVKVESKDTAKIKGIIETNKGLNPKEKFKMLCENSDKINFTKIAETLNVSRKTLYEWKKDLNIN